MNLKKSLIEESKKRVSDFYIKFVATKEEDKPKVELMQKMYDAVEREEKLKMIKMVNELISQAVDRTVDEVLKVVDGHKEVYTKHDEIPDDLKIGDEKEHADCCCNETLDDLISKLSLIKE